MQLKCLYQEEEDSKALSRSAGDIVEVKSLNPTQERIECGKVTKVFTQYAIIDDSSYVSAKMLKEPLNIDDNYKYEAIKSHIIKDGYEFYWRVTNLIEKVICNEYSKYCDPAVKMAKNRKVIPGQKFGSPSRFSVRFREYLIPSSLREFNFTKKCDLLMYELKPVLPFLFEELNPKNYVAKMRYFLYLEQIELEIQFAKYRIERGSFENFENFLRLKVEGVAERRPSIVIGDSIKALERNLSKRHIFEGIIHKVGKDYILVKFQPEFHQQHYNKEYRIEFVFSLTPFKKQQHALDSAVSKVGLGLDFIFPRLRNFIKPCQVDVELGDDGNMLINDKRFEFYDKNLNMFQKNAVTNILRGVIRPLPYIIYGPPGKVILIPAQITFSLN